MVDEWVRLHPFYKLLQVDKITHPVTCQCCSQCWTSPFWWTGSSIKVFKPMPLELDWTDMKYMRVKAEGYNHLRQRLAWGWTRVRGVTTMKMHKGESSTKLDLLLFVCLINTSLHWNLHWNLFSIIICILELGSNETVVHLQRFWPINPLVRMFDL